MEARTISALLTMVALAVAAPAASHAGPQATCKAMCQRFTDCQMSDYTQTCLDACHRSGYEEFEEGRTALLTLTRYSCQQIRSTAAGTDGGQPQPSSTRTASPPNASRQISRTDAPMRELDQLQKKLNDLE